VGKILLYYKYVAIEHPKQTIKWQKKICQDLELTGRVLIAHEGINGTLGGSTKNTQLYIEIMQKHPLFADIDFKESNGSAACFPKLQVKVRDEVVSLGIPTNQLTHTDGGKHLKPSETHALIKQNPDDLVILDARNNFEWKIGKFKNTITPDIDHFRDFPQYIDEHLDQFKNKQVLMYCTGGIRCERASTYLKQKDVAKQIYQMEGGIHRYTEQYPDGFFRGKNYVFDGRVAIKINDDILGTCKICHTECDDYTNCINALCNKHFICCANCLKKMQNTCNKKCLSLVAQDKVHVRPKFKVVNEHK